MEVFPRCFENRVSVIVCACFCHLCRSVSVYAYFAHLLPLLLCLYACYCVEQDALLTKPVPNNNIFKSEYGGTDKHQRHRGMAKVF